MVNKCLFIIYYIWMNYKNNSEIVWIKLLWNIQQGEGEYCWRKILEVFNEKENYAYRKWSKAEIFLYLSHLFVLNIEMRCFDHCPPVYMLDSYILFLLFKYFGPNNKIELVGINIMQMILTISQMIIGHDKWNWIKINDTIFESYECWFIRVLFCKYFSIKTHIRL